MSNVWTRAILPMIIGFIAMFGLIWLLFEIMGITEYVWPIIFPTFAITLGIFLITLIVIGIICRAQSNSLADNQIGQPSYSQMYSVDSIAAGAVYVIPVYCPNCQNKLELDRVDWIDSGDLTCPSCFSTIQSSIREDL